MTKKKERLLPLKPGAITEPVFDPLRFWLDEGKSIGVLSELDHARGIGLMHVQGINTRLILVNKELRSALEFAHGIARHLNEIDRILDKDTQT